VRRYRIVLPYMGDLGVLPMSGESGSWEVDTNEDDSGVIISFAQIGDDGVETFTTAMPIECALEFGRAIVERCEDVANE
jgi:hypothetical protein